MWSKISAGLIVSVLVGASLWSLSLAAGHTWAAGFPTDREYHATWSERFLWSAAVLFGIAIAVAVRTIRASRAGKRPE